MAKRGGGQLTKPRRERLLADLRVLFESGDIRYYSVRDLSSKFNIAKDTVSKYLDEVASEAPAKDIEHIRLRFKEMFENAIETCENLLERSKDPMRMAAIEGTKEVRDNIKLLMSTIKEYTDFMERFFIKDKVADKLEANIREERINININVPVVK